MKGASHGGRERIALIFAWLLLTAVAFSLTWLASFACPATSAPLAGTQGLSHPLEELWGEVPSGGTEEVWRNVLLDSLGFVTAACFWARLYPTAVFWIYFYNVFGFIEPIRKKMAWRPCYAHINLVIKGEENPSSPAMAAFRPNSVLMINVTQTKYTCRVHGRVGLHKRKSFHANERHLRASRCSPEIDLFHLWWSTGEVLYPHRLACAVGSQIMSIFTWRETWDPRRLLGFFSVLLLETTLSLLGFGTWKALSGPSLVRSVHICSCVEELNKNTFHYLAPPLLLQKPTCYFRV